MNVILQEYNMLQEEEFTDTREELNLHTYENFIKWKIKTTKEHIKSLLHKELYILPEDEEEHEECLTTLELCKKALSINNF